MAEWKDLVPGAAKWVETIPGKEWTFAVGNAKVKIGRSVMGRENLEGSVWINGQHIAYLGVLGRSRNWDDAEVMLRVKWRAERRALRVLDESARLMAELANSQPLTPPGALAWSWEGRDEHGRHYTTIDTGAFSPDGRESERVTLRIEVYKTRANYLTSRFTVSEGRQELTRQTHEGESPESLVWYVEDNLPAILKEALAARAKQRGEV